MSIEQFVELVIFAIPILFTCIFLVMLIEEDVHDFGISDRIADTIDRIKKTKGGIQ